MCGTTFTPGSWPPSPGFDPCAILICSSSADRRYAGVTPKRADATCLVRLPLQSPSAGRRNRSGSSPPSPLLLRAPSRFIAIATARCASGASAPTDIAEAKKRRQIASTGSTSSSGIGWRGANSTRSRIDDGGRACTSAANSSYASWPFGARAVQLLHDERIHRVVVAAVAVAVRAVVRKRGRRGAIRARVARERLRRRRPRA